MFPNNKENIQNIFGGTSNTGFSTLSSNSPTTSNQGVFGAPTADSTNLFNVTSSSVFNQSTSNVFGSVSTASQSTFGSARMTSSVAPNTQMLFGNQTSTAATPFTSAALGTFTTTSSSPSFNKPTTSQTLFGGQPASLTQSLMFGQQSTSKTPETNFGTGNANMNVFGGSSVFGGTNNTPSSSQQGSLFGQQPSSLPNKSDNQNTEKSLFGGQGYSADFGKERKGTDTFGKVSSQTESSNLFGQSGTNDNIFGNSGKTDNVFGRSVTTDNLFAKSGNTDNLFGKSETTANAFNKNVTTDNTFGKSADNAFGKSADNAFGKNVTTDNLFGKSATTENAFGKNTDNAFGKNATTDNAFGKSGTNEGRSSEILFGKTAEPQSNPFGKLPSAAPISDQSLFGKTDSQDSNKNVFGKSEPESSKYEAFSQFEGDEKTGLFGKKTNETSDVVSSQRALFQDAKEDGGQLRKKRIIKRENDDVQEKRSRNLFSRATAGVFGTGDRKPRETIGSSRSDKDSRSVSDRDRDSRRDRDRDDRRDAQKDDDRKSRKRKESSFSTRPEESEEGTRRIKRMSSVVEDVDSKISIVAKGIPARYNKVTILRNHFSHYGIVKRVYPNVNKSFATIHFDNHDSALRAKYKGHNLVPGQVRLQLIWGSHTPTPPKPSPGSSSTAISPSGATQESEEGTRRIKRLSSAVEDVDSKISIVAKGIPASYNKVTILYNHFSNYGIVKRVFPNVNKSYATIHFDNHDSASRAKQKGHNLVPGQVRLQLFWGSYTPTPPKPSPGSSSTAISPSGATQVSPRKSKWESSDVDDELAGMAGTSDITGGYIKELHRPKDLKRHPEPRARSASPKPTRSVSPSASPVKVGKTDNVSLSALFQTIAKTYWEKKELLDIRDKLIRQSGTGDTKKGDLATAKAFIGTCPDMCPEKERYDRQETRRLSIYEMVSGSENVHGQNPQIDPNRAVKEYSRSSADQTEPLQHELRPEAVLMTTMTYLLSEIADRGEEERWADWYDFLWNRTRSIRKDITQQQLCNQNVAELIEKCSRYHIYCSHRLCELDMMVFDTKINNENLTKCLQTLKEMYFDLEKHELIFCPNEAEFRAYMVLMNLNQGDTLREVQELRLEVRESPQIKFALKVYSALNSHNYVKFFRLVKQGTFLNGCIIHRYFTQVRSHALLALMRALGKAQKYPLSQLVRILGFEDTSEVEVFCSYYGLMCKEDCVVFDYRDYLQPEASVPPRRSVSVIEAKLTVSVGQIIYGKELPVLVLPVPTISFDNYGKFIMHPEIQAKLEVNERSRQKTVTTTRAPLPISTASKQIEPIYNNEAVKSIARELFLEVINEYLIEIATGPIKAYEIYLSMGSGIMEEMSVNVQDSMIRNLCDDVIKEAKLGREQALKQKLLEERKRKEKEMTERIERLSQTYLEEYLKESCSEESQNIADVEFRSVQAKLEVERKERCSENLVTDLLQEVSSDLIDEMAADIYEVHVVQRKEQLSEAETLIKLKRAGVYFNVWKTSYQKQIKLKRAMLAFPCGPSVDDSKSQIQNLLADRRTNYLNKRSMFVSNNSRLTLESTTDVEKRNLMLTAKLSLAFLHQHLQLLKAWQPLDITRLLQPELLKIAHKINRSYRNHPKQVTWKLVVSIADSAIRQNKDFCDWLKIKFQRGVVPLDQHHNSKNEILSLYTSNQDGNQGKQPVLFSFCVQCLTGCQDESTGDSRVLLGCGGLIFVLPLQLTSHQSREWRESEIRLSKLITTKPIYPSLPLVVICTSTLVNNVSREEILNNLNIDNYIEERLISDVYFMEVSPTTNGTIKVDNVYLTDQLSESVQWLGKRIPEVPYVQAKPLDEFISDVLLEEYFTPVLQDLHTRKSKKYLHQSPTVLISLYNSVMEYIVEVITSPILSDISWPVPEFTVTYHHHDLPPVDWNTEDHLLYLSQLVSSIQLPEIHYQDDQSDLWQDVCHDVWSYITLISQDDTGTAKIDLISRVKRLLKTVKEDFEDTCYLVEGEENCQPTYINMPWTDLIQACIDYKLKTVNYLHPNSQDWDNPEELKVYYTDKTYTDFTLPGTWKTAVLETDSDDYTTVNKTFHRAVEKHKQEEREKRDTDSILSKTIVVKPVFSSSILTRIHQERKEANEFEKYLESVVNEEMISDWTPQSMDYQTEIPCVSPRKTVLDGKINDFHQDILENGTISEKLKLFQDRMDSDKIASHLFEQKLEYLLNS